MQAQPQVEPGSVFTAVSPVRVLDTRSGVGAPAAPVGPGATVAVDLSSRVPASATAVVLNVTGTEPTASTYVTVFPHGATRPLASNLNLLPGMTRPNAVTVALGGGRVVGLFNFAGNTHLVADLAGYYSTGTGAKFTSLVPDRVLDTRTTAPVGQDGTVRLDLSERVPASATAVVFNLTGVGATASTFVTAFPAGAARPTASNLNLLPGEIAPNLVTVAVGANRSVDLYNRFGSVHLVADLAGFYTPDYGATFTAIPPRRVLDTRDGTGSEFVGPIGHGQIRLVLGATLPVWTTGVVLNVTGTEPTGSTFVTVWPDLGPPPTASNLNLEPGQTAANLASVAVGSLAAVNLYNHNGTVHLIADLAGYFGVPDVPCTDGCVYAWGDNFAAQLGTGSTSPASAHPTPVYGLTGATAVSAGSLYGDSGGYALRSDGTVVAWGGNSRGQLGNGWRGDRSLVPVPVLGLTGVVAVAHGDFFGLALRSDGTVWWWGLLAGISSLQPVQVPGLTGVTALAANWSTAYVLRSDGTVHAWGDGNLGQLGNGSSWSSVPVPVSGLTGVTGIAAAGYTAFALRGDGTAWAWGINGSGQLGNGAPCGPGPGNCQANLPVQVSGLTTVTAIAADPAHGFAIMADGTARAWGENRTGGLGNGTDCDGGVNCESRVPVPVSHLTGVDKIAGHGYGGFAVLDDGSLWGWGDNARGQLAGAPDVGFFSTVPVRLPEPAGVTSIDGGLSAGFAVVP